MSVTLGSTVRFTGFPLMLSVIGTGPGPRVAGAAASATGSDADAAFGDLLFEVVALAQLAGVDPEGALRRTATQHLSGNTGGTPDGLVQFPTPPSE